MIPNENRTLSAKVNFTQLELQGAQKDLTANFRRGMQNCTPGSSPGQPPWLRLLPGGCTSLWGQVLVEANHHLPCALSPPLDQRKASRALLTEALRGTV